MDNKKLKGFVYGVGFPCPEHLLSGSNHELTTYMIDGQISFIFSISNIQDEEIKAIQYGEWWFSLRYEQEHIILCCKVKADKDSQPWIFESVFSLNKVPKSQWQKFLNLEDGEAYPLEFLLVDKNTKIVRAMRLFGLSGRANKFLYEKFIEQSSLKPRKFDVSVLPIPRKSFDSGFIKEKSGTK